MKNVLRTIPLGFVLLSPPSHAAGQDPALDVEARVGVFATAFRKADLPTLQSMLGEPYVHTNSGHPPLAKDEWLAYIASRRKEIESGELRVTRYENKDVKITLHGNTALVTGVNISEGVRQGKPFATRLRFTQVWAKSDAGWQRIAFQDAPAVP